MKKLLSVLGKFGRNVVRDEEKLNNLIHVAAPIVATTYLIIAIVCMLMYGVQALFVATVVLSVAVIMVYCWSTFAHNNFSKESTCAVDVLHAQEKKRIDRELEKAERDAEKACKELLRQFTRDNNCGYHTRIIPLKGKLADRTTAKFVFAWLKENQFDVDIEVDDNNKLNCKWVKFIVRW
jgi:hypothetical protein